jgi:hypothetical protein
MATPHAAAYMLADRVLESREERMATTVPGADQTSLDDVSVTFASQCPRCRREQPQRGFTSAALRGLLDIDFAIYAHCLHCDVQWPISAQDRVRVAKAVARAPALSQAADGVRDSVACPQGGDS